MPHILEQFKNDFYGGPLDPGLYGDPGNPGDPGGPRVRQTAPNPNDIEPTFDVQSLRQQVNRDEYESRLSIIDKGLKIAKNEGLFTLGSLITTAINPVAGALSFMLKAMFDDSVESKEDRMAIEAGLKLNRLAREETGQNLSSTDIISSLSDMGFRFRTQEVAEFIDSTLHNQASIDASRIQDQSELIKQRNTVRLETFLHNSKRSMILPGGKTEWFEYGTQKSPGMGQLMEIAQKTFGENVDYKLTQKPNGSWAIVVDDEEDYKKLADVFLKFKAIGGDESLARQALNADDSAYLASLELRKRYYQPTGVGKLKPVEVSDDAQLQVEALRRLNVSQNKLKNIVPDPDVQESILRTEQNAEKLFNAVSQMPDLYYSNIITSSLRNEITKANKNVISYLDKIRAGFKEEFKGFGPMFESIKEAKSIGQTVEARLIRTKTSEEVMNIAEEVLREVGEDKFKKLYLRMFEAFNVLRLMENDPKVLNRLTTKERAATKVEQ